MLNIVFINFTDVPLYYILNIKESLDSMLEGLETEMIIDEEHDS